MTTLDLLKEFLKSLKCRGNEQLIDKLLIALLKVCERTSKIISNKARSVLLESASTFVSFHRTITPRLCENVSNHPNKVIRLISLTLIKEMIANSESSQLRQAITEASRRVLSGAVCDSCSMVREAAKGFSQVQVKENCLPNKPCVASKPVLKNHTVGATAVKKVEAVDVPAATNRHRLGRAVRVIIDPKRDQVKPE